MKIKIFTHRLIGLLLVAGVVVACQSDNSSEQKQAKEFSQTDSFDNLNEGFGETFYRVPSPEDLFDLVSSGNVTYSAEVLNPAGNISKYVDTKSKEFNFGVYSADLAYTSAFQKYQESYEYIETVRKLSNEIGIASVFDEALLARVHNIFENSDSLMSITNNTYTRFVYHLEQNDRGKTLAMVSAGGWVESLFIVVNLVGDYKEHDVNVQRIADQKLTFENLIDYLMQYKDEANISKLISDLSSIKKAYDQIKEEKSQSNASASEGQLIVGAGSRIVINKTQYDELRAAIIDVRNKLTMN